ncbi:hypothetical protein JKP88DRAFT_240878 [Tribonema minus]|uniref:Uncharacterized protein n=1 Tax=Tribonema minus TaxID=303371 RepID=A0A835Z3D5_9STRA|nr:hypothetical protein JKP88DRAFT_240878 [Tribonema minus]
MGSRCREAELKHGGAAAQVHLATIARQHRRIVFVYDFNGLDFIPAHVDVTPMPALKNGVVYLPVTAVGAASATGCSALTVFTLQDRGFDLRTTRAALVATLKTNRRSGAMIPFKNLLAYMASVLFFLPWIIMVTPCSLAAHVVLLVTVGLWEGMMQDPPRGPMFRQIGGTRKRANAIVAATIGRARKCRRPLPAQWSRTTRTSRTSCTNTATDTVSPHLLRSLVLKALCEHVRAVILHSMAQFARGAITAAAALAAMRVVMPAIDTKPLYALAGVAGGQAISSYKQYAHFGGGSTTRNHTSLLLTLLLQACSLAVAMDDGFGVDNSYMAPLVSAAAGMAAAVITAATDSSGSDDEVATNLHAEQLNAEQLREQHPLPITAADFRHMEIHIQEALAEDLLMNTMDGEESDEDGSDVEDSDVGSGDDSDVEDLSSSDNVTPPSRRAAGGVAAVAARARKAVRNVSARIQSFSIMGCNQEARKVLSGAVLALQTSLINGDPAAVITKSDKQKREVQSRRNKSCESQQTFTSLENLLVTEAKKVDLAGDTLQLRVWVSMEVDHIKRWVRGWITSCEVVDSHRIVSVKLQRDRLRINNNTIEDVVGVDGPIKLDITSYREETSQVPGASVFGPRAPAIGTWFLIQSTTGPTVAAPNSGSERNDDGMAANVSSTAAQSQPNETPDDLRSTIVDAAPGTKSTSKRAGQGKGKRPAVRTPTRTELLSLSDVLKRAEPEQGVTPLCKAWGTFLLQRACLVFEGMLVLHVYLTDSKVKRKSTSRLDPNEWTRKGKYLRDNQRHLHSDGKRTHGIVRAIADSITCDHLLPPTQHRYTHLNTSGKGSYLSMCWPGVTQQTISTLELEIHPEKTVATGPVNSIIKILSTAAVLGRLPTCASGAVMLTQDELKLALSRIHATTVADDRQPFGVLETLVPPSHPSLPPALEALVCSEAGGVRAPACVVNSTPMARMDMWFLSADTNSGEAARSPSAYNNLMSEAQFCRHTIRSIMKNAIDSIDLTKCTDRLREDQCYIRVQLKKWQATSQTHEHNVDQGRMLPEHLMYLIHDMLAGLIERTWKPFERAIQLGLELHGRQMADLDGLVNILARRRRVDGFNMAQTDGDCAHLEVDWVTTLAHHMLEEEQFTTYDVANLEILVHLHAYYLLPVRPESLMGNLVSQVWARRTTGADGRVASTCFRRLPTRELGKIAMTGGGEDSEPMKTCVPVPEELNRPMLTVLFLCRAMRTIHFGSPPPDRLVGLSGGSNHQVAENTFRDKVLNEIGRCNLGIPYYASYSNRCTAVTEIFAVASTLPWGEQQDFIASSMKELHSSIAAGQTAYRQFLLSLDSKVQNRGKRHRFVEPTGEGNVDVPRPPPALRPMSLAGSDGGSGGGSGGGGAQAIAEMAAAAITNMQNLHRTSIQQMQATHELSLQQHRRVHNTNYRRTSKLHGHTLQRMSQVHSQTVQQSTAAHRAYLAQQQQQLAQQLLAQQQWAQQQRAQQQRAQEAMFLNFLYMQQRGMYPPYGHPPPMMQSAHTPANGHNTPPQMLPAAHGHAIHHNASLQMLPVARAQVIRQSTPGVYHFSHTSAQNQMPVPEHEQSPPPGTPPM